MVITGGGSGSSLVEGLAKDMLRLPSRIGNSELMASVKGPTRDASWFVAYGLARLAQIGGTEGRKESGRSPKGFVKEFLRQFLP